LKALAEHSREDDVNRKDELVPLASSIVTIAGMGLMGGSLGMALVKNNVSIEVRALVSVETMLSKSYSPAMLLTLPEPMRRSSWRIPTC